MEDTENYLMHYGVKGMKWGVRRELKKLAPSERQAYVTAKDAKWTEKVNANPKLAKVSRIAARDAKRQTKKLKADYKARGLNVRKPGLDQNRYDNELKGILEHSLDRASYRVHKTSPSRLSEVQIHRHPDGSIEATIVPRTNAKIVKQRGQIARADEKAAKAAKKAAAAEAKRAASVSHAADDEITDESFFGLGFMLVPDDEGFVDDILTPFDEMQHDAFQEEMDATLMHYGVKGMKWGVRKRRSTTPVNTDPTDVTIKSHPGGKIETSGGRNQPPHDDAKKAAAYRQQARASSPSTLSNQQLRALLERTKLESEYAKIRAAELEAAKSPARKFLEKFLAEEKKTMMSGKKPKTQEAVEHIISLQKKRTAAKAAGTAVKVATKAIGS